MFKDGKCAGNRGCLVACGLLLGLCAGSTEARAMTLEDVSLNGFGSLSDGLTNRNEYLSSNTTATRVMSSFAVAFGARPVEALSVFGQIRAQGLASDLSMDLDWAFAEWTFDEALKLRAGRCKLPLGFYSETRDVGTLRPFLFIPQGVYGLLEMSAEAYNGAGLTGSFRLPSGWGFDYDLFGGNLFASLQRTSDFARQAPPPGDTGMPGEVATAETGADSLAAKLVGLRLGLSTPIEGLRVFSAGYFAVENDSSTRLTVAGAGAELLRERLTVRLESFLVSRTSDALSTGGYLELAYHLTSSLEAAARAEASRVTLSDSDSDSSLLRHNEGALGLNYWFSPNFVIKTSVHLIDGNLFAQPADLSSAIANDTLVAGTLAYCLGAQFSF